MSIAFTGIEWDALDPGRLVEFWSALLGRESIGLAIPDAGTGFGITFVPTSVPKPAQNRIHFDLTTSSLEGQGAMVERALELGGMHADVGQTGEEPHVVLADPEGNEFCVVEPENSFLADTGAIGAVNCDGTAALGRFWSAALEWPLVWDQDDETAIQSPHGGSKITWSGPPLKPRVGRDRLRFVVSAGEDGMDVAVQRLEKLGARSAGADILTDPDGNEFLFAGANQK